MKIFIVLTYLGVIIASSQSVEINGNPQPPYPVLKLKFEVNLKNSSQLLGDLIDNERYVASNPQLPASELLINTNIQELTLEEWKLIQTNSKLNFSNINIEKIKEITKTLNINPSAEYTKFIKMLNDPSTQMNDAMSKLNVSAFEVMFYVMNSPNGDEHFFDSFQHANFSNWPEAQKILNLTDEQLFDFNKNIFLQNLGHITLQDFGKLIKNITGEMQNYHVGYEKGQLGLIISAFDVLETYPDGDFGVMLKNYNESIVNPLILATRIKSKTYLSSAIMYDEIVRMSARYTKPFLVNSAQSKFEVKTLNFNGSLVELTTNDSVAMLERDFVVTQFQKCLYAPNLNETLLVTITNVGKDFHINKGTNVEFVMGAPLFCDGQLVGVALTDSISNIIFARVPFKTKPIEVKPVHPVVPSSTVKPINVTTDYIATIEYVLIKQKYASLVAYLLLDSINGNHSLTNIDGLTSKQVIQSYRLNETSFDEFNKFVPSTKPSSGGFMDTIHLLQKYNVSILDVYKQVSHNLTETQKSNMFKAVNVNYPQVMELLFYNSNDVKKFRDLILTGTFNRTTIDSALKVTNLTTNIFYDTIKPLILQAAENFTLNKTLDLIQSFGGYESLNKHITSAKIAEDTIENSELNEIITHFEVKLKQAEALAPIVSRKNLLTTNDVFDHFNDATTLEFIEIRIHNDKHVFPAIARIVPYTSGYTNLTLSGELSANQVFLHTATSLEPKHCKYVTDKGVYKVSHIGNIRNGFEVVVEEEITRDLYKQGAGLVCEGRLYGVATKLVNINSLERIQFAGFSETKPVHPEKPVSGVSKGVKPLYNSFGLIICCIVTFISYFH